MGIFTRRYSLTILIVILLTAAMLPIFLIYYTAHTYNAQLLLDEVTSSLMRQNQDFSERLQDDMTRIVSTNYMLTQNWELGKLAVIPEAFTPMQKALAYENIQDKIFLAQLSSRFIEDISVYFPKLDKCLSTNSSPNTPEAMRQITAQLDTLDKDCFINHNDEMIIVSESTFSQEPASPGMVIQTTLSKRELIAFYQDIYWNHLSNGMIISRQSTSWPQRIDPNSMDAFFYRHITDVLAEYPNTVQDGRFRLSYGDADYEVLYSYIPYAELILMRYYDVAHLSTFGFSRSMLALFAAVVALMFLMIYIALYRLVKRPLDKLTRAFARVEEGELNFEVQADERGEFGFVFAGFSHMLSRLRVLIDQTYKQGQMVKKSEFKQLQAQIDPHFLYNGFFILNKRIRAHDNEGALSFSKLLSDYFRYVTQNAQDHVPLCDEAAHAYDYARIQQIRFANRLGLSLDRVPEAAAQISIPRLVLQPIVENVFRHVLDDAQGMTTLHISYHDVADGLEVWVEDSGAFITDEKLAAMRQMLAPKENDAEVSGLANVHMRLQLFCGEQYGLLFDRSDMGGLRVRVHLFDRKERPT